MKTKISHLGRSSVSVILAVMMLLSTMLIGTVSTVNAIGADSSYTVHEGETLYLNLSNTGATEANFFEGNYIEGSDYFSSPLPDNKIVSVTTLIISKKPGNTGISRDIRTEFTTDLLLSD